MISAFESRTTARRRGASATVRTLLLLPLVWGAALAPVTAHAQASDADADRATARALARHGYEAQQRGAYATAAQDFERADALVHAPTLLLGLARAQAGLGRLVEAQETYQRILREGVDPRDPAPFARALEDARHEVKALAPRLAWVTIDVRGPRAPSVRVDQVAVPRAALGVPRACNPGTHTVTASAEGFAPAERTFVVGEGWAESVTLALEPLPAPASPSPPAGSEGTPFVAKAGIVAVGVGVAGLLVGAVTGAVVLVKHASLSSACPDGHCSPGESDELSAYHGLATVSTVSTIAGACTAVTGAALLLATPQPASVTAYAGPLGVGIAGVF